MHCQRRNCVTPYDLPKKAGSRLPGQRPPDTAFSLLGAVVERTSFSHKPFFFLEISEQNP